MLRAAFAIALCVLPGAAWAGTGADILFRDASGAIPAEAAEAIYRDFFSQFLTPSADGTALLDEGGRPAGFQATVEDLNHDGVDEIFVIGGNTYLSGYTGSSIWLFVRDPDGTYAPHLGFPAAAYEILPEASHGFPDLRFGGPGFCRPVWRWDGADYQFLRKDGQCPD
jgi:hypothetical protein